MRIVKIWQFGAKLRAFENREKWPKMSDFSQIHVIQSFLVIFRDFQIAFSGFFTNLTLESKAFNMALLTLKSFQIVKLSTRLS